MNEFENYFYHKVPHVFENSPAYFPCAKMFTQKRQNVKNNVLI
jgi:hypothetical protein